MGQTSNTHAALCGVKAVDSSCSALENKNQKDDFCRKYSDWWNGVFVPQIKVPGVNMFDELEKEEICELFSFMPESILGSLEPSRAQKLMETFFQQLMPEIQQKNPKLFARIISIQKMCPEDVWKNRRNRL